MRKSNKKASAMGGEAVIVWIIVIAVLILGFIFVSRMGTDSWMKNLPGFQGPAEQDREIDIDLEIEFDCKYPIGKIPIETGRRTIHLLDLKDVEETEFEDIDKQIYKATKKEYLKLTTDGEVLYSENEGNWWNFWQLKTETKAANTKEKIEKSKPTEWSTINFNSKLNSFIFNDWDNNLPGIHSTPENLKNLKKDLKLLYNARYHSSTELLCGNPTIIESLKEAEKCIESCKIHGGECKEDGGLGEINLGKIDCKDKKKCFRSQHSFDPDRHLGALIVNQIPEADQITTNTNWEFIINKPYAFSIKLMQVNQKNNFCYSIRTEQQDKTGYSFQGIDHNLEIIESFSFNNSNEGQIIFSAWSPSLNKATIIIFPILIKENPQIKIDLRSQTENRTTKETRRTINTLFITETIVKIRLKDYFSPYNSFPQRNSEFYFKLEKEENKINIKRNSGNLFGFIKPDGFLWLEKSQFKTPMQTMTILNKDLKFYTEEEEIGIINPKVYSKTNMVLNYNEILKKL
jgi:hypothetical protein